MPRWLIADTDVADRYPCWCKPGGNCSPVFCTCAGPDADAMPPACCSHHVGPEQAARAQLLYTAGQNRRRNQG